MNAPNEGPEMLRRAIETVADDLESRPAHPARRRMARPVLAGAAAAAVLALVAVALWLAAPGRSRPEVEVLMLEVHGREVGARILDGASPGTILVLPRTPLQATATTAAAVPAVPIGGTR